MIEKIDPDIKKLVIWRIDTSMPNHFKLVMGNKGSFTKEELKRHVEKGDEIGLKIVEMEMNFIKALSTGQFSKALAESYE